MLLKTSRAILVLTTFFAWSAVTQATVFTSRALFEAAISISYKETFQSLGNSTQVIPGPVLLPSGLTVSSTSNQLFVAGPGQSTNPTTAIGSNTPIGDPLIFDLGGDFFAFGGDFFQNFGGGGQGNPNLQYKFDAFDDGNPVASHFGLVQPNGGSFFGFTDALKFDRVIVLATPLDAFEVADNITVGNMVPEPATVALFGFALAGLGFARRRVG